MAQENLKKKYLGFNKEVLNERRMKTLNFIPQLSRFFIFIVVINILFSFFYVIINQIPIWERFGYVYFEPERLFGPIFNKFIFWVDGLILIVYGGYVIKKKKGRIFLVVVFSKN